MSNINKLVEIHDVFDALSNWITRQEHLNHGSDFQLSDQALNVPVRIAFEENAGLNEIDAWGLRVSLVHMSCITMQPVPTDQTVRIALPIPGPEYIGLEGRIVFCSQCLPGMYRTGVVFDWESLAFKNEREHQRSGDVKSATRHLADR